ncbi:calcium-binding protein CBP-like [Ipomoea triloba]|uniref:calcium-binding protein CBP-like n=1 Tax=Ipomoea triloba TaxID=35885 RepID=UPI00125DE380|nr:calcium-binding protein CBP-like [Ipomoea triloba]
MSGYPNPNSHGYGYSAPPPSQPYSVPPPSQSYSVPPPSQSYSVPPPSQAYSSAPYGVPPPSSAYGAPPPGQSPYAPVASPYSAPSAPYASDPSKPPKENKPQSSGHYGGGGGYPTPPPSAPYGSAPPFGSHAPSNFPPGTDPNVMACFQMADQDGSGLIDDKELQRALSSYNQSFSLRTVHLLMYLFTNTNTRKIGPKEFTAVFYSLQNWRAIFERFDRDRSGKIDTTELREALLSLGFAVSPAVLELLVTKFDKTGGHNKAIEYDNFIECCLTVKGLTEKFKDKDTGYTGSATFTYESFMLTVLPFLIA